MITPRFLRALSQYLKLTSQFFHAIPFEVKEAGENINLQMTKNPKEIFLFHINFSIQCEAMIYSFLRLCQMHLEGNYPSIHPYVIHVFNMVGFGYPAYLQVYSMFYGEALCNFFNQAVNCDKRLRRLYWKRERREPINFLETGASVLVVAVYFQGLCFGMYSLMSPGQPYFHCSLLMELGWSMWAQVFVKVYECYMFINCWHVIVSVWITLLAAGFPVARWPNELIEYRAGSMKTPTKRKTLDNLRTIPESIPTYRQLQMLTNRVNAFAKIWLSGVSYFTGKLVVIYMGFASFKMGVEGTLPMSEYLAYPTSFIFLALLSGFVFPEAEKWHANTELYIKNLLWHPNRIVRKSIRTLRPCAGSILDLFYSKRGSGLECYQDCAKEISDLIISFA